MFTFKYFLSSHPHSHAYSKSLALQHFSDTTILTHAHTSLSWFTRGGRGGLQGKRPKRLAEPAPLNVRRLLRLLRPSGGARAHRPKAL